jgi:hypothetical protein
MSTPHPDRVAALISRLEKYYGFECEGGSLMNCVEWQELKRITLAAFTPPPPAPAVAATAS